MPDTSFSVPRPNSSTELQDIFGNPYDYMNQQGFDIPKWEKGRFTTIPLPQPLLSAFSLPERPMKVTELVAHEKLTQVFVDLHQSLLEADLWSILSPVGQAYCFRGMRKNQLRLSTHAYGVAVDYPMFAQRGRHRDLDKKLRKALDIFRMCGFVWGGSSMKYVDPSHFQYVLLY